MLEYYLNKLNINKIPSFLNKYLESPSLIRLKKVGYFCGMDYASKDVYNFSEYISRYDHSLTCALLTYKLTKNKEATIAALFHDIATPCFSHVIDYMNKDYEKQESTELYTEKIIRGDNYLCVCLKSDGIDIDDIINFKKFKVVDNERPKLCADRLDGIILTGYCWTKNISLDDINKIVDDIVMEINEYNENEISFRSMEVANNVLLLSEIIDKYCHSKEDNYMMELLAQITKFAIDKEYISYEDLYYYDEEYLFNLLKSKDDKHLKSLIEIFENIKSEDIPNIDLGYIKVRDLNPLVKGKRLKK